MCIVFELLVANTKFVSRTIHIIFYILPLFCRKFYVYGFYHKESIAWKFNNTRCTFIYSKWTHLKYRTLKFPFPKSLISTNMDFLFLTDRILFEKWLNLLTTKLEMHLYVTKITLMKFLNFSVSALRNLTINMRQ